jgi:hypothetical protein
MQFSSLVIKIRLFVSLFIYPYTSFDIEYHPLALLPVFYSPRGSLLDDLFKKYLRPVRPTYTTKTALATRAFP